MAETPTPRCWDGMELGSRAAPSVGRTFGCAASNLFWGGGWFWLLRVFFFLNIITPSLGSFQKYNLEKNGARGKERGAFWISACCKQLPYGGRPAALAAFPSFPRDFRARHPLTLAWFGLETGWGHLGREATAAG